MVWLKNKIDSHGSSNDRANVCTGLTYGKVSKQMKDMQISAEKPTNYCYICKRKEGAKGAVVICDGSDVSLSSPEIKLFAVERDFNGGRVVFFLCFECALLLNSDWYKRAKGTK